MHRWSVALVLLATLVLLVALPAAALELQGEHRLMARYADDLEVLAAEVLVLRHGDSWVELVVTQRWSPRWPARMEAEVSLWRTRADGTTAPGSVARN
jgi:hypothetical protein